MADRVRWQLDGLAEQQRRPAAPPAGIAHLTLAPDEVVAAKGRQLGFWGGETAAAERAARALARVDGPARPRRRPGPRAPRWPRTGRAGGAGARRRRRPHRARRCPVATGSDAPWPGALPTPAPACLWPDPARAEVVDRHDRPVGVSGRGLADAATRPGVGGGRTWAEVAGWAGPWPVDERWWDAARHRRRARFQVLTAEGVALLLGRRRPLVAGGHLRLRATDALLVGRSRADDPDFTHQNGTFVGSPRR